MSQVNKEQFKSNNKKTVRFASPKKLKINELVLTNTFQIGELCKKCGTYRTGPLIDLGCKNCLIPKPSKNLNLNKSEFLSRSKENLNNIENEIEIENPSKIPEILEKIKLESSKENESLIIKSNRNEYSPAPIKPRKNSLQHKNYKCFLCGQELKPGDVAIVADQVDSNARFHPECFSCSVCYKVLADLLYYTKDHKIYCENHYELAIPIKYCGACNKLIESKEYISAENNYWHVEHFTCWECETSLADQKYTLVDSKVFCFDCHQRKYAKVCLTCNRNILPDEVRFTYEKLNWHPYSKCFKCSTCEKDLIERPFLLKKNRLFCSIECKKALIKN